MSSSPPPARFMVKSNSLLPARFVVNSNSLFLCGIGNGAIAVMDTITDLNSPSYPSDTWKIVATAIGTMTSNAMITKVAFLAGSKVYRGLEVFGTVIEGSDLDTLQDELLKSQLLVNRDGYQVKYFDLNGVGQNASAGFVIGSSYMSKLNNVFGWGRYGVKPAITTVWNRYNVAGGEVVVDYLAAEETRREMAAELEKQRREIGEWESKSAEKEEVLGHYKRVLEESKELMREKESGKERLREVIEEKNRVVEEQSRVIKEKEMEIQKLKSKQGEGEKDDAIGEDGEQLKEAEEGFVIKEKVLVGVDEFKAAMDSFLSSCRKDLKAAIVATNRVFFLNVVALALLLFCVSFLLRFG